MGKNKYKRVSVIVLTYNNLECLEDCIKSIFIQTYPNIELIIQDDGSKLFNVDSINKLFEKRPQNIQNVIVNHNDKNLGTVKNYNNGILIASGEYIVPLACDDNFYDKEVIEHIVDYFETHNYEVCTGYIIGEISKNIGPTKKEIQILNSNDSKVLIEHLYASNFICGASTYWKKDFLLSIDCFDTSFRLVEDYPMMLRLANDGVPIGFIPYITVIHGEGGISTRINTLMRKNKLAHKDAKLIKDKYVMPNLDKVSNKYLCRYIKACYDLKFYNSYYGLFFAIFGYLDIWFCIGIYLIWKRLKNNRSGISFYEFMFLKGYK